MEGRKIKENYLEKNFGRAARRDGSGDGEVTAEQIRSINRQYIPGFVVYGLSFVFAFIHVGVSVLLTILLATFYAVTASTSRRK